MDFVVAGQDRGHCLVDLALPDRLRTEGRCEPATHPFGDATGSLSYRISAVAARYNIHPQTLRMYEREGLLQPSRSRGNPRLYTEDDLQALEVILHLTREMGVNLAGVDVVLNMRQTIVGLQNDLRRVLDLLAAAQGNEALVPASRAVSLQRVSGSTEPQSESDPIDSAGS